MVWLVNKAKPTAGAFIVNKKGLFSQQPGEPIINNAALGCSQKTLLQQTAPG